VVLNYHSGEAADHLRRSPLARSVIAKCERTVVPSRYLVDVFAAHAIDAAAIPNVVDTKKFAYRERSPLRPRILSVRNFESLYNVACTLRAFQLVQRRWPNAELTLVGSGSEEPRLRALARELALERVTFTGRIDPSQMAGYYASHDIYVQTPDIDNMPISVLEAYASGLPVVSTDAGGVPSILTHDEDGLLAPVGDHAAIAGHILRLLEQPGIAREFARSGQKRCDAFTWPNVRDLWLSEYRAARRAYEPQAAGIPMNAGAK
jgi:glycosyltransferase involved in cell wall biosynthesis